jgi:hypothetical protein
MLISICILNKGSIFYKKNEKNVMLKQRFQTRLRYNSVVKRNDDTSHKHNKQNY